ncbi:MAG: ATP-binding protein [Oceanospirillaceae bacterium]|nr:ATP-binding protein [Oceanospirillaceae bacterium]
MPKKFIQKVFPSPEQVQNNQSLRFLSPLFSKSNLWHLNRRCVARAFLVGLFAAFLPLPFQMFIAAFIAFYANANLPISVGLVWISNPITIPPLFYGTYLLGAWMLDTPPTELEIELSLEWAMTELSNIWEPLFVGSLTTGITLGVASYFLIHLVWRMHVWDNWKKRKLRQTENNSPDQ